MVEIKGTIEDIIFRNESNGFTVMDIRAEEDDTMVTCVGHVPSANEGEVIVVGGEWTFHPDYGEQLKIEKFSATAPSTLDGIEKYLASGLIRGVGPSTAKKIIDEFGSDSLDIIQYNPQKLTKIDGIGSKRVEMIASSYREQLEIKEVMMFLQKYGISTTFAIKIYKAYGDNTIRLLEKNPYRLATEISGIGFKTADNMAQSMGITKDSKYRVIAGTQYVLSMASSDGHTYIPKDKLIEMASDILAVEAAFIEEAIMTMAIESTVFIEVIDDVEVVYLAPFYHAEVGVCRRLIELSLAELKSDTQNAEEQLTKFSKREGIFFADRQREAIIEAISNGVLVITGGPGTGKTTTINCIIELFEKQGLKVGLAAPTGRAAKRMTETTGKEAKTIHRLLEYGGMDGDGFFQKDEDDPLKSDVIIVDEMSMVDIILMNNLLKAITVGTRLIMVGDSDQLPSVGPGNVLRDIINSKIVKVVRLDKIFRQAGESMIVLNAHRINRGEYPKFNVKGRDFFLDRKEEPEDILKTLIDLVVDRLPGFSSIDPHEDIQILSPMRKGIVGVNNLNEVFQDVLNPPSRHKKERRYRDILFRQGDKVMQIRNNYNLEWKVKVGDRVSEEGEGVFNGDMGFIESIDLEEQTLTVIFDDNKEVVYDFSLLDELELAYAISVHKSQGSEFPVVIIPIAWGPPMLMTRNLLYTGITRAREMVVLVGRERMLREMVDNNYIAERYSGLDHHFQKTFNTLSMAGEDVLPFG
ncbi:MAG: ATP-dependent RecD-like DNA helicase [Clostridiales bacterium]|nr:ATP-dependent RecD-like DNA helicase [Clostridiales bacterium]